MAELPSVPGQKVVAAFTRAGFAVVRVKGSHHIMKHPDISHALSVPVHGNKPVRFGTLKSLISAAQMTVEEFRDLL